MPTKIGGRFKKAMNKKIKGGQRYSSAAYHPSMFHSNKVGGTRKKNRTKKHNKSKKQNKSKSNNPENMVMEMNDNTSAFDENLVDKKMKDAHSQALLKNMFMK